LDLRQATLALGDNQGFVIANGLLDVFAPGDAIEALSVEEATQRTPQPTPELVLPTATATITATTAATLTATAQPTAALPTPTTAAVATEQPASQGKLPSWGLWVAGAFLAGVLAYWVLRRPKR